MIRGGFFAACLQLLLLQQASGASCPTRTGNTRACCCDGGVSQLTLKWVGCWDTELKQTTLSDNSSSWKRHIRVLDSPNQREVFVMQKTNQVSRGSYLPSSYKICAGGDCATFDLSCKKPIGAGHQVGNWRVVSLRTKGYRSMTCPKKQWFPVGRKSGRCPSPPKSKKWKAKWKAPTRASTRSNVAGDLPLSGVCNDGWIETVMKDVNALRSKAGVEGHQCNERLAAQAEAYSKKMCDERIFTHNGFTDRCEAAGFSGSCSENLAWNMNTASSAPEAVVTQWKNSKSHYRNLVASQSTVAGYGYHKCSNGRVYWTGLYSK